MASQFKVGNITVDVVRKDIKHAYLRVDPPDGRVRLSAPLRLSAEALRAFAVSKVGWIERQRSKIHARADAIPLTFVDGDCLEVWGAPATLEVSEKNAPPALALKGIRLHLQVQPGTDVKKRQALVEAWYRDQLKTAVLQLLARWEPLIGVKVKQVTLRKMKTRWGSCSTQARTIRLNSELARQSRQYLEYVVVHELTHLLEPSHNARFRSLMDQFLPGWRTTRRELNRLPIGHPGWGKSSMSVDPKP